VLISMVEAKRRDDEGPEEDYSHFPLFREWKRGNLMDSRTVRQGCQA